MRFLEFKGPKVPSTKGEWVQAKKNAVVQYMLGSTSSLRNVVVASNFLDNVLKQMKSPEGWTDKKGVTHFADEPYKGNIGTWPPSNQPVVSKTGTPDPYNKTRDLAA